jgi:hypothetical protein
VKAGPAMGEIVNLRGARKRRRRELDEAAAAANRLTHGVAKAAKEQARAEHKRAEQALEGHHRERDDGEA